MKKSSFIIQEVEIHYVRPLIASQNKIASVVEAHRVLRELVDLRKIDHKEFFWVVLLNQANMILGFSEIGKGSTNQVSVNIKEIFQLALRANASSIILAHNHPSGNLTPSDNDIKLTEKVKEAAKLLDIDVCDHIILTSSGFTSLLQDGHC